MLSAATEMRSILYSSLSPSRFHPSSASVPLFVIFLSLSRSVSSTALSTLVSSCLPRASARTSLCGFSLSHRLHPSRFLPRAPRLFHPLLHSLPSQTLHSPLSPSSFAVSICFSLCINALYPSFLPSHFYLTFPPLSLFAV